MLILTSQQEHAIHAIEAVIHEEVGRNFSALFSLSQGGLLSAVQSIVETREPMIRIITGFYIPGADPPAAETDGPLGAAFLAAAFSCLGIPCRLLTDHFCAPCCEAALEGIGISSALDVIHSEEDNLKLAQILQREKTTHCISVERVGPNALGLPCNMRGIDISPQTILLHTLFQGGAWQKIAIGDGGNEIGMGSLPRQALVENIAQGERIACTIKADTLITAGVSNWGGYALVGALAIAIPAWRSALLHILTVENEQRILKSMVDNGPAVDGLLQKKQYSVDGLPMAQHQEKIRAIRELVIALD